jgi:hypothetical protein
VAAFIRKGRAGRRRVLIYVGDTVSSSWADRQAGLLGCRPVIDACLQCAEGLGASAVWVIMVE